MVGIANGIFCGILSSIRHINHLLKEYLTSRNVIPGPVILCMDHKNLYIRISNLHECCLLFRDILIAGYSCA